MHFVLLDKIQASALSLDSNTFMGRIIQKAYADDEYRDLLLSDAKTALKQYLGIELPWNIIVHANSTTHIHLVIPTNPDESGELHDTDLAIVAGGKNTNGDCNSIGGFHLPSNASPSQDWGRG